MRRPMPARMPANARAILIEAFRDAHRWLDALVAGPRAQLVEVGG